MPQKPPKPDKPVREMSPREFAQDLFRAKTEQIKMRRAEEQFRGKKPGSPKPSH